MKTFGKLKLNQFSKDELQQRQLNALRGGACYAKCVCNCAGESLTTSNPFETSSNTATVDKQPEPPVIAEDLLV